MRLISEPYVLLGRYYVNALLQCLTQVFTVGNNLTKITIIITCRLQTLACDGHIFTNVSMHIPMAHGPVNI